MSDTNVLKNALVASLYELATAAQNTANATVNLVNSYKLGDGDAPESLSQLADTLLNGTTPVLSAAHNVLGADKVITEKKKKAEKDPNAPKKPLTMYFAFSFDIREKIKEERKKKGLEPLSAVDMNGIIKEKWANITPEEREKWQKQYQAKYLEYQKLKDAYDIAKKEGGVFEPVPELEDEEPKKEKTDKTEKVEKVDKPEKSEKEKADKVKSDKEKSEKKKRKEEKEKAEKKAKKQKKL